MFYRLRYRFSHLFVWIGQQGWLINIRYHWDNLGTVTKTILGVGLGAGLVIGSAAFAMAKRHHDLRAIKCIALNIYHEARGEPRDGQFAVAHVTLNRARSPDYPDDVCAVVFQRRWHDRRNTFVGAFSWTVDAHPDIPQESTAWRNAFQVAREAYYSEPPQQLKEALFYHADYVNPRWARKKTRIAKIGRHIFYK